jgi:hypothetical protein
MKLQFERLIAAPLTRFTRLSADQIGTEIEAGQQSICETLAFDRGTASTLP